MATPHPTTVDDPRRRGLRGAHPAQILVLFAFFSTAMLGMLGLATDLGVSFAGRRSMQNAADAAALAGARQIVKAATTPGLSVQSEVNSLAAGNVFAFASSAPTVSCSYVTDADAVIGDCSGTVPPTATGVRVSVTETHPTFFIRVIPGAPSTATTSATATAHVQLYTGTGSDGPFIVCGFGTRLSSGSRLSLLLNNNTFNPAANGQTFLVHGPQIARCGLSNNSFKGLADQDANAGKGTGEYWYDYNGVKAGPTRVTVDGIEGCAVGADPDGCVLILPIATNNPAPVSSNPRKFWIVKLAAFRVRQSAASEHEGTYLANYIVRGSGQSGWCPTCGGGLVVIRLTQ